MRRFSVFLLIFSFGLISMISKAQEFNARVTINSDQIQTTNKRVFETLSKTLTDFINTRKWTNLVFDQNERIDCSFTFIITEMPSDQQFKGELQVQARRPVYNTNYTTTLFNYRDKQIDFEYTEFAPLEFNETTISNNLVATVVYYLYVVLGLDFDSFSSNGGTLFFNEAQRIVSMAQSQPAWTGWKAFGDDRNRHALITALTENVGEYFRKMWYEYHRKGLDEMSANVARGRATLLGSLNNLSEIYKNRPMGLLLQFFSDCKLDEVVQIYTEATRQEKNKGYKLLSEIFPTEGDRIDQIKQ